MFSLEKNTMINFTSDTQTEPTFEMREAMLGAPVGDERNGTDPSVNALNTHVASLLGKEAAIFCPSGTMCNLIALLAHSTPGNMMVCEEGAHIYRYEKNAYAEIAGLKAIPIQGTERGTLTPAHLNIFQEGIRDLRGVLILEQSVMNKGGTLWQTEEIMRLSKRARSMGLRIHIDGARLFNAAVALGESPNTIVRSCDSVWVDFTKGLGAPFGACPAGTHNFIDKARQIKLQLGGGMRQAGIMAAGALYALQHNIERLSEDHRKAALLASELKRHIDCPIHTPHTNIVLIDVSGHTLSPDFIVKKLGSQGILVRVFESSMVRLVTHLGISNEDIQVTLKKLLCILR